jgi:hypothetical protein
MRAGTPSGDRRLGLLLALGGATKVPSKRREGAQLRPLPLLITARRATGILYLPTDM